MRSLVIIAIFLAFAVVSALAQTGDQTENNDIKKRYLYEWTDSKGMVHITDDLGDVPEGYRSKVRKREMQKAGEPGREPREQSESPSVIDEAGGEGEAKAEWQQRIKDWNDRLESAEKKYQDLERERTELLGRWGSAAYAPIESRIKAQQLEEQMKDVQREIDEARNMLDKVIPEEARKAGVPPGWLRE